ncbi:hypothetical protein [Gallaecimonas pentaromativorans]|uniref:hypothetical protein n=1 Tax=Gallaecimonas pentaromativorans TaxID=584787 RepID=UPI0012ED101D|nr:hypothetical protein [Gallaecimonas pentaromativorans]
MTTSNADYRFILKELPDGDTSSVWALECYPESKQLPFISDTGCMYIKLKPSVTEDDAKQLGEILNKCCDSFVVID